MGLQVFLIVTYWKQRRWLLIIMMVFKFWFYSIPAIYQCLEFFVFPSNYFDLSTPCIKLRTSKNWLRVCVNKSCAPLQWIYGQSVSDFSMCPHIFVFHLIIARTIAPTSLILNGHIILVTRLASSLSLNRSSLVFCLLTTPVRPKLNPTAHSHALNSFIPRKRHFGFLQATCKHIFV